ncbi:MAG: hypothetical protein QGD94_09610, partial [Planctomycetia bacterium]|nr:hypothetical protein [Planctomycetia bacterium]
MRAMLSVNVLRAIVPRLFFWCAGDAETVGKPEVRRPCGCEYVGNLRRRPAGLHPVLHEKVVEGAVAGDELREPGLRQAKHVLRAAGFLLNPYAALGDFKMRAAEVGGNRERAGASGWPLLHSLFQLRQQALKEFLLVEDPHHPAAGAMVLGAELKAEAARKVRERVLRRNVHRDLPASSSAGEPGHLVQQRSISRHLIRCHFGDGHFPLGPVCDGVANDFAAT